MRIGVHGAGAIGCYVGGRLLASGEDVVLVGRASVAETAKTGLVLTDQRGDRVLVPAERVRFELDPTALSACDFVLVTVKCSATESAGAELARVLDPRAIVVSFQNGIHNAEKLRAVLPKNRVLGGMVPFNIARTPDGRFHRGTDGPMVIEDRGDALGAPLVDVLKRAGIPAYTHRDIAGVLYGKLLFNLNNATNALSGVPIRTQLMDPAYRAILADVIHEGRSVLKDAGIRPVSSGRMFPWLAETALKLPTWLFERAASAMIALDKEARSSMSDDLDRRRKTEIDELNGEIVRLGMDLGLKTPVNSAIVSLIKEAEAKNSGSPRLSAADLRARIASGSAAATAS